MKLRIEKIEKGEKKSHSVTNLFGGYTILIQSNL